MGRRSRKTLVAVTGCAALAATGSDPATRDALVKALADPEALVRDEAEAVLASLGALPRPAPAAATASDSEGASLLEEAAEAGRPP